MPSGISSKASGAVPKNRDKEKPAPFQGAGQKLSGLCRTIPAYLHWALIVPATATPLLMPGLDSTMRTEEPSTSVA